MTVVIIICFNLHTRAASVYHFQFGSCLKVDDYTYILYYHSLQSKVELCQHSFVSWWRQPRCLGNRKHILSITVAYIQCIPNYLVWLLAQVLYTLTVYNYNIITKYSHLHNTQSPSVYCSYRKRALEHTLSRLAASIKDITEPLYIYGDFNFRLDFSAVVKVSHFILIHVILGTSCSMSRQTNR